MRHPVTIEEIAEPDAPTSHLGTIPAVVDHQATYMGRFLASQTPHIESSATRLNPSPQTPYIHDAAGSIANSFGVFKLDNYPCATGGPYSADRDAAADTRASNSSPRAATTNRSGDPGSSVHGPLSNVHRPPSTVHTVPDARAAVIDSVLSVVLSPNPSHQRGDGYEFLTTYLLNKNYQCVRVQGRTATVPAGCIGARCADVSNLVDQFEYWELPALTDIARRHALASSTRQSALVAIIRDHVCHSKCAGYSDTYVFKKLARSRTADHLPERTSRTFRLTMNNEPTDDATDVISTYNLNRWFDFRSVGTQAGLQSSYGSSAAHIIFRCPNIADFLALYKHISLPDLQSIALSYCVQTEQNKKALLEGLASHGPCNVFCDSHWMVFTRRMFPRADAAPSVAQPHANRNNPSSPAIVSMADLHVLPIKLDNTIQSRYSPNLEEVDICIGGQYDVEIITASADLWSGVTSLTISAPIIAESAVAKMYAVFPRTKFLDITGASVAFIGAMDDNSEPWEALDRVLVRDVSYEWLLRLVRCKVFTSGPLAFLEAVSSRRGRKLSVAETLVIRNEVGQFVGNAKMERKWYTVSLA
ncbi:hypothetical protein K438DRAFT_2177952 [Mycena galopus ATCC 62051]|nr:hypothetical protein K438DRAFT_2177952 [Mycena galopus ATCC 62051]